MGKRIGMEVSIAAAEAVKQANVDVISAYPITPQTHIVEHLSEIVANGELDAEFFCVESEHSALSVCVGAAATGARTFTCTSSQGLALMSEITYIASGLRLPMLMILSNRTLSAPLSIWNDHSDTMSIRDCGWIQFFVENGQEVYDHVFVSYRLGEDKNVLFPVIINMDGFILSHVIEPIELIPQDKIDQFLPPYQPVHRLHPDHPVTMGAFALPSIFAETKKAQEEALRASMPKILETWKTFGDMTGRYYQPVETYKAEDADTLLVTMGSCGETASVAVDKMREEGKSAGLVKLRLWRPFPFDEFKKATLHAKQLVVIDRAISVGACGPVASEVKAALYGHDQRPSIYNFVAGISGRDVTPSDFIKMVDKAEIEIEEGNKEGFEIYGVRE
ncbi:MAG TPA: transketolase C-terminal domain-containing protein [Thermodesulfobacteriota bacterium]|nr:transketolase C-terminal domain-containing protein [Thermodesulfobacteriota bacterium]